MELVDQKTLIVIQTDITATDNILENKMRITVKQLKQLVREAVEQTLLKEYEQSLYKDKNGDCFIVDDEGNEEFYDGPECEDLEPGQSVPFHDGRGGHYRYRRY